MCVVFVCSTDVSVDCRGKTDGFFLAAVDGFLQRVDHLLIRVDFIIEQHAVVGVSSLPAQTQSINTSGAKCFSFSALQLYHIFQTSRTVRLSACV